MTYNTQNHRLYFLLLFFILYSFSTTAQIPTTVTIDYNDRQGARSTCSFGCNYNGTFGEIISVTQGGTTTTKDNARYLFNHPGFTNSQITKIVLELKISKWSSFTTGPTIMAIKAPQSSCNDAISWTSNFPGYENLYNCNNFGDVVYSDGFGTSESFATTYFLSIYDEDSQVFPNQTLGSFDQNSESITLSFTPLQGSTKIHDAKLIITYNDISTPETPVLTGSSNSTSSVNLNWNAISNASSYNIYSCTNQLIGNTTTNSYTINNLTADTTYGYKVKAVNINGSSEYSNCIFISTLPEIVNLQIKVFLQGAALNPNTGEEALMRDDLRILGLLPTTSPYSDGLTCNASVFNTGSSPENDIVDWIWVELRDQNNNNTVLRSTSALLQRDGDIVSTDGVSNLSILVSSDNYFIAVKHRNHLGIMSANTFLLSNSTTTIDFTDTNNTATYGSYALTTIGMPNGISSMWCGDVNGDNITQYEGANADPPNILSNASNHPDNFLNLQTFVVNGYSNFDVDMNGTSQYTGTDADTPYILQNVLGHPNNFLNFSTFSITEQLP